MLERRTAALTERLERLERDMHRSEPAVKRSQPVRVRDPRIIEERRPAHTVAPHPAPRPARPAPKPSKRELNVEDLLGGRVLAWLGGIAVLVGIALFFSLAVSQGWIGPAARTLVAGAGALGLLGAGVWLHDRKGRTEAALAAISTAIAGLFATVTVAAQVYDLIPSLVGLVLSAGIGAIGTTLAIRWEAKGVAALGIGGCLLAPVLVGAPASTGSMAFLLVAGAAAAAVLIWQRWQWLAFGAFAISTPQWISWLLHDPRAGIAIAVLACFGVLNLASAVGFELRMSAKRLRRSATFLVPLNALVLATVGYFWLASRGHHTVGELWLVALALVHMGFGLAERRVPRISHDLGLISLVLGVATADAAYGLLVSGPALAAGWAAGAVALAIVGKRTRAAGADRTLAELGLGVHVGLALARALLVDAPPSAVTGGGGGLLSAAVALSALAAACFASARLAEDGRNGLRMTLDSLGLAALAYLTAIALDGPALAIAWAGEAGALAQLVRRSKDKVALVGATAFLGGAVIHALALDAPPHTTVDGVQHLLPVAGCILAIAAAAFRTARAVEDRTWRAALDAVALGAVAYLAAVALDGVLLVAAWAGCALVLAELARRLDNRVAAVGALALGALASAHATLIEAPPAALIHGADHLAAAAGALLMVAGVTLRMGQLGTAGEKGRAGLLGSGGLLLLYTASVAVVSAFEPGGSGSGLQIADFGPHQLGQVLLSALWSVAGVGALVIGLRRDERTVRIAGLGLLLVAVGKVFLYDLSTLTSVYRVASFVGLGLLLLGAAFAWQRVRPRPLPDLRDMPRALR
ncbi:MAG TPA: DUF2339 domain-containing protein [Thermoleophilaceae bacterium]|nr:DUF2339 domain-containing protein [Thermoleophilaceae bacterium]